MKIASIGAGRIGATAARLFAQAGHDVALSNSRGPDSLAGLVTRIGPRARALTVEEAARWAEVVLLAVPWRVPAALPTPGAVEGKVVIDAMNPYGERGEVLDLAGSSSSEETARRLPGARLVKAFNTIYHEHLAAQGNTALPPSLRRAIPLASDDTAAKALVAGLIEEIGFAPLDTGGLRDGGLRQQPGTALYNRAITGAEAAAILERA